MNQFGSSRVTVATMGKFIASRISLSWPDQKDEIMEILNLAQEFIWKTGLFHGSTGVFTVKSYDGKIVTPPDFNILLGINLRGKPTPIRDRTFIFHRNGPGNIEGCGWRYSTDVYDLGEHPTTKEFDNSEQFQLVVKSSVKERLPAQLTRVGGIVCGRSLFTYKKLEDEKECACICETDEEVDEYEAIEGVDVPIRDTYFTYNNIVFSSITNITKPKTLGYVHYLRRFHSGESDTIAVLGPNQTRSSYRHYRLPEECPVAACGCTPVKCGPSCKTTKKCGCGCTGLIEGLFKRNKPDDIVSEHQYFIIEDKLTTLAFAQYMWFKYDKKSPEEAAPYLAEGMALLNADIKANKSNTETTIQFDSPGNSVKSIDYC